MWIEISKVSPNIILALASGVLLTLSFPPFDLAFLAWIALVPFFLAIHQENFKSTLILSLLAGMIYFMGTFFWINYVKGIQWFHYLIFGIYLGLFPGLFGLVLRFILGNLRLPFIVAAPPIWVAIEYLRSQAGFMALPWNLLGHSQHENLPFIQIASFSGAYGVSFCIVLVNGTITDLILFLFKKAPAGKALQSGWTPYRPVLNGILVLVLGLALWLWGSQEIQKDPQGKQISISVVQGNIPQSTKWKRQYRNWIFSRYEGLSDEAAIAHPKLIAWPEASTPGFVLSDMALLKQMIAMVRRHNTYFLVGSAEYPKFSRVSIRVVKTGNTALFLAPTGKIVGQYLKIGLLPFGEYIPYHGTFPWPEFLVPAKVNSNMAGRELVLFNIEGTPFGTLICSEIMYPHFSRDYVKKGAAFIMNLSNEAWFGRGSFSYQFLSLCVFRAVENRVNVVRATNTGISCFINPYGKVEAKIQQNGKDLFVSGILTREIRLLPSGTLYTRFGDLLAYGCLVLSLGLLIWSIIKKPTSKENRSNRSI